MKAHYSCIPAFVYDYLDTLRVERKKLGYSLCDLSSITGVSPYTIDNYERGRKPAKKSYNKLALFFNWRLWND